MSTPALCITIATFTCPSARWGALHAAGTDRGRAACGSAPPRIVWPEVSRIDLRAALLGRIFGAFFGPEHRVFPAGDDALNHRRISPKRGRTFGCVQYSE